VQVEVLSSDPTRPPRLAIWLAAWLAGQLGWQPQGQPRQTAADANGVLQARFLGPGGEVALSIMVRPSPGGLPASTQLMGVTLTCRGSGAGGEEVETFRLSRPAPGSPAVRIEAEAADVCCLPRMVDAPELDLARRVAATLESSCVDLPFQNALPIALWLLESAESRSS